MLILNPYFIQSYRKQFRVPKHNQHKRSELVPCQFSTQSIRCVQRRKKRKKEEKKKKEKRRRKETNTRERLSTPCGHYVFQSTSKTKTIFLLLSFIVPTQQYIYIGLVTGLNSDATNQNSNLPA